MAREVLVTGATGTLGHRVVGEATEAGHKVRALSRKSHVGYTGVHWAQGDLLSGEGIDAALDGIDTVIHCATQGTRAKDVVSADNLIAAAQRAKTANIIYVSIAGIDRIPMPYYKVKLRVEEALTASGRRPHDHPGHAVPRSDRDDVLGPALLACVVRDQGRPLPAHRYPRRRDPPGVPHRRGPAGRVDDIGGPAVFGHDDLGADVSDVPRQPPTRGRPASARWHRAGLKSGANLVPANPVGTIGFAQYLARTT